VEALLFLAENLFFNLIFLETYWKNVVLLACKQEHKIDAAGAQELIECMWLKITELIKVRDHFEAQWPRCAWSYSGVKIVIQNRSNETTYRDIAQYEI
jgi:hypothetical protein